jgi:hypothetical protein
MADLLELFAALEKCAMSPAEWEALKGMMDSKFAEHEGQPLDTGSDSERSLSGRAARDALNAKRQPAGPISGRAARLDLARRRRIWREHEAQQQPGRGRYHNGPL